MILDLLHDLRYSLRTLTRSPGFTAVAVLTLAIGIGASTTVFNVANWVLLRPVPGTAEPDRLVRVRMSMAEHPEATYPISHPNYADLRARSTTLTDLAATFEPSFSLAVEGAVEPRRVDGELVTANYFDVLGVRPALGRTFSDAGSGADGTGAEPVAVISHRLWRGTFGGEPGTVGRTVTINGHPFTVIGVAPEGFLGDELPGTTDLWVPVAMHGQIVPARGEQLLADRSDILYFEMVGRLAAGVEPTAAEAELRGIVEALAEEYPGENRMIARLDQLPAVTHGLGIPAHAQADVRQTVWILAGVVGMLLLLTCANVANLLLARASRRRRELAVRQALGAGRARLARLFLTESTLLALAGAALALVASL
ncbi:MAG: ABC transporter permease, partial [Gemmatimonadota bacterium]